ncbi:tetratricopeptide repeat protein [Candidatus Micrarchaeota archaeon]|nr:tetratricopeptide repeat protein [Candidatus Micrarchaeota archaeon]
MTEIFAKKTKSASLDIIPSKKVVYRTEEEVMESKVAGVRRIAIEGEISGNAKEYARRYQDLVDSIAKTLKEDLKIKPREHERFITEVWGMMNGNLKIRYGNNKFGFISESLATNQWDCDNSAFFVFDVARKLGIDAKLAYTSGHTLITIGNFAFETVNGNYLFSFDNFYLKHYYGFYLIGSDDLADGIAYYTLGGAYHIDNNHLLAVQNYSKAIKLGINDASIYHARAQAYDTMNDYSKAIKDYNKAIELQESTSKGQHAQRVQTNPIIIRMHRAICYGSQGDKKKALEAWKEILEIEPDNRFALLMLERYEKSKKR